GRRVRRVVVHVVAVAHLAGPAMAAAVVSHDSIPLPEEVEHLGVPVIGAQWPAVMEDDRLRILRSPVLVENLRAVFSRNEAHPLPPFSAKTIRGCEGKAPPIDRNCSIRPIFLG